MLNAFTAEDEAFRDEARTWLRSHIPDEPPPPEEHALRDYDLAWQREQWEGGWAGIAWPTEFGGKGLSLLRQMIWHEEYAAADAPYVGTCFVGLNDAGPTLIERGTDEQRAAHLAPILQGDVLWCQGYSEPGAGSDLASLTTSGELDGDDLVVTGEKIWCSYAQVADRSELLVRTDPESPRHAGLSWVIVDLRTTEGVEIEPLPTLMGNHHYARVRYREARIPTSNVVGRMGDGWSVANSSLRLKRATGRIADQVALARTIVRLGEILRDRKQQLGQDYDVHRDALAIAQAEVVALRAMTYAELSRIRRDGVPTAHGSGIRVYQAELNQRVHALAMEIMGPDALAWVDTGGYRWTYEYLWAYTDTIGAGTKEIQRTIVGERLLGLPRDR